METEATAWVGGKKEVNLQPRGGGSVDALASIFARRALVTLVLPGGGGGPRNIGWGVLMALHIQTEHPGIHSLLSAGSADVIPLPH